jgi:hypothetical protein
MKYRINMVKAMGVPGPSENSPPAEYKVVLREVELLFIPFVGMDYAYHTDELSFEETVDSVAYLENDGKFEVRIGYSECKDSKELQELFDAYVAGGYREVLPPEDESKEVEGINGTSEESQACDDILPKDLDDRLRGLQ